MSWIYIGNHKPIFYADNKKTLLETLEDAKVELYSECRNGYCGTCRTKLVNGDVHYTEEPLTFLDNDECLPCCAYPSGDIELKLE